MRKIFLAFIAVAFASSLCFAKEPEAPLDQTASKPVETKTFTGKIKSVSLADSTKKTKPKIIALDEKGQKFSFMVRPKTTIHGKDGRELNLSEINKDDKVIIDYSVTAKGVNRAKSIKVVE